jgi:hypothetical protein
MQEWIEAITLGEAAALAALLAVIVAFLRKVIPALRKASRLIDDVVGVAESEPGRGDGRPGVMDRLAAVERRLGHVADAAGSAAIQLHPNGGHSTRDQIDALRAGQERIERQLNGLTARPSLNPAPEGPPP